MPSALPCMAFAEGFLKPPDNHHEIRYGDPSGIRTPDTLIKSQGVEALRGSDGDSELTSPLIISHIALPRLRLPGAFARPDACRRAR